MTRLAAGWLLLMRFTIAVVESAASTAWLILTNPDAANRGMVTMDYSAMSESGAVVLAALVTLTPGTSIVTVDHRNRQLLIHMLDVRQAPATLARIEHDFVQPLQRLLGEAS